jgi:phenylacetate-coenzyme A ligase PaaK-like adenylate-forming protein
LRPFLTHPAALWRLGKGFLKSRIERRQLLPRDIWSLRGIIGSGVDSLVYKNKIKEYWGRRPLDLYSCTEGGVIATQAWNYDGMTFVPNLNFLEFIPEEEQVKLEMDRTYKPRMLLLDEVQAGENYELVITNFYGGMMTRYRIGDMVRIKSLSDEKLGINLPQMVFERRVDDTIDFVFVRLTEKTIWQAIENTGIPYTDWVAFKREGESVLQVCIEPADGYKANADEIARAVYEQIIKLDDDYQNVMVRKDFAKFIGFKLDVTLLPRGTFHNYTAQRQAEGADLAHLKPPHVNPSHAVLSFLLAETEEIIEVTKKKVATGIDIPDSDESRINARNY